MSENYTPRLRAHYRDEIRGEMQEEFSYENVMQIPGITKVAVNMGIGAAAQNKKQINGTINDLTLITGQKPETHRVRKPIANSRLREGDAIDTRATLRDGRMWESLDRLLTVALPRIRDFRDLSDQQSGNHGNYTFDLSEQTVFYEIDVDEIDRPRDVNIATMTTVTNNEEGHTLLRELGFPFKE